MKRGTSIFQGQEYAILCRPSHRHDRYYLLARFLSRRRVGVSKRFSVFPQPTVVFLAGAGGLDIGASRIILILNYARTYVQSASRPEKSAGSDPSEVSVCCLSFIFGECRSYSKKKNDEFRTYTNYLSQN